MGVVTAFEIEVPASALALGETFERAPDATVQLERTVGDPDDRVSMSAWVSDVGDRSPADLLEADSTVAAVNRLGSDDGAELLELEFEGPICRFARTVFDRGGVILRATAEGGVWQMQLRFADSDDVAEAFDDEFTREFEATVTRLYGSNDAPTADTGLTDKQKQALDAAFDMGYYEIPRTVDLRGVGERLGISRQAVSERLRRGHELLVADLLGENDDSR
ncbi:helix-turn-helix domain-containing protein [Halorussus gelatinilyticus]|uniref:Helix-turn-helix domain-containing protein n=1 Tax=Halorussus gelatinilyticus TaxID=2937524 RepID=A0A8U0IJB6_9EURY|nr:helix-turn-helix domain-containing protein [Halorussus gelatinilyticus]UPW01123.1 helix-turn-helix domain-containing protein [Halorussus gelatinilyticus]